HVLPAGEFRVEAAAQFQHGRHAAANSDFAFGRRERAGDDLQQRALARAVAADHAQPLAGHEVKTDVFEGPEVAVVLSADAVAPDRLLESILRPAVDLVALAQPSC